MPKITGKIIRIPDKKTIVVNLGRQDGIVPSSIFSILAEPEAIVDPFSDEELGSVTIVKSTARASRVEEKFTIATTKFTRTYRTSSIFTILTEGTKTIKFDDELRVKAEEVQPWKAKTEEYVEVGDIVEVEIKPAKNQ